MFLSAGQHRDPGGGEGRARRTAARKARPGQARVLCGLVNPLLVYTNSLIKCVFKKGSPNL